MMRWCVNRIRPAQCRTAPPPERDSGMSLVELLVAMSVTIVLLASVGTVFIGALRTLSTVNSKAELSTNTDLAMRTITQRLRAADYRQPESEASNTAVQAASATSISINAYLKDAALAASLSATLDGALPGSTQAAWMAQTQLVPTLVQYSYATNSAACGGKPGIIQTTTPPRIHIDGAQVLAWDTGASNRCILRTSAAPDAGHPMFRYYTGCGASDAESSADLGAIRGIGIQLRASDATVTTPIVLQNRICLVNVGGTA
jgi:type II secretory pathway component PulJ